MAAHKRRENIGDLQVLRAYERRRRLEAGAMLQALDGLHRLYSNDSGAVGRVRRAGQALFNRSATIKRLVARQAIGL